MTARIHALNITLIVALLRPVTRRIGGPDAGHAAGDQAHAGAHAGALRAVDRSAGGGADQRTDQRTGHAGIDRRIIGSRGADRLAGIVAAHRLVGAELVKALVGAGQRHQARPGRNADAGGETEQQQGRKSTQKNDTGSHRAHRLFDGATFCHVLGQLLTVG